MSEFNSAEMAGGKAIGLEGEIRGYNADVEARLANILVDVARWVDRESGALMGHIKMAVTNDDQTVTMNITDLDEGVLFHGKVRPSKVVKFSFMAAVLDVDEHQLEHKALHAFDDSGIMVEIHGHSRANHDHEHGEGCTCGCHDHHHHHEHGEECTCGCHDHDHEHEHHHHHEHGEDCKCGCHDHDGDGHGHHHHDE